MQIVRFMEDQLGRVIDRAIPTVRIKGIIPLRG
jgi:hypothetical protein